MKKKLSIGALVVLLVILLFPLRMQLKDGGTQVYRSVIGIYEITDWHRLEGLDAIKDGITVKLFGLTLFDNSGIVPAAISFASDPQVLPTAYEFSEGGALTATEQLEKAKELGYVTFEDGDVTCGQDIWLDFYEKTGQGESAAVQLANYYTLDDVNMSEELYEQEKDRYPLLYISTLHYDGTEFQLTTNNEDGTQSTKKYLYLVKYEGKPRSASARFQSYIYYCLVNDKDVTWGELEHGMFSSQMGDAIDFRWAYKDYIYE